MNDTQRREIEEFLLWLTPCGDVFPGPSYKAIGRRARQLVAKLIASDQAEQAKRQGHLVIDGRFHHHP